MKTRHLALLVGVLAATLTLTAAASEGHHRDHDRHAERDDDERGEEGERGGREASGRREGGDRRGRGATRAAVDPVYAKECGACHLAFPPSMLPAASWRRMMGELERHFGQNAELADDVRARLEGWLVERSGQDQGGAAPQRISELPWFRGEHRKIPAAAVTRPAVRSLANCAACHQGAAQWDFDEDQARIPRG